MSDPGRVLAEYQNGSDVVQIKTVAIDPRPAINYLRSLEWNANAMNNKCPSCGGLKFDDPERDAGHHPNCNLAHALLCLHQKVVFR